jgi:hypothetical protein
MLPTSLTEAVQRQLAHARRIYDDDRELGLRVSVPSALDQKYPAAPLEWPWQYLFQSRSPARDPRSGLTKRHHLHEDAIQRAV